MTTHHQHYPYSIYDADPAKLPDHPTANYQPKVYYPNVNEFVMSGIGNYYHINPYMVERMTEQSLAAKFAKSADEVAQFLTEGSRIPITRFGEDNYSVRQAFLGVPQHKLTAEQVDQILQILQSKNALTDTGHYQQPAVESDRATQFAEIQKSLVEHGGFNEKQIARAMAVIRASASVYSDAIYTANYWLFLGFSPVVGRELNVLDDDGQVVPVPVIVAQSPRFGERQAELLKILTILPNCVVLVLDDVFEGLADLMPGPQATVLGSVASRSTSSSYDKLMVLGKLLDIPGYPDSDALIKLHVKQDTLLSEVASDTVIDQFPTFAEVPLTDLFYHGDLSMLPLADDGLLVVDQVFEEADLAQCRERGIKVIEIPLEEGLRFGMNSILTDERRGARDRRAVIPTKCPVLRQVLSERGYQIHEAELLYQEGGGFQRCMTAWITTEDRYLPKKLTVETNNALSQWINKAAIAEGHPTLLREFSQDEIGLIKAYL